MDWIEPNKNNHEIERTNNTTQKVALLNSTTDTLKQPAADTDRAWFSRLLRHPARKRISSVVSTPESARGSHGVKMRRSYECVLENCHVETDVNCHRRRFTDVRGSVGLGRQIE